ncbi:RNA polymerase sigma factor [Actinacidiphila bryophytorum]|uniref:RNA polymerase sigma-70 factor, ECF subfamily n=2 Tax=Actinacidiphila bryophytorum TaxID=1436133 RepID=A0A9W4E1U7_9ACTN|nr:RNA polymerase sigma-70 factor, ECF subfamily [Actinacidiphila bryophytorum]
MTAADRTGTGPPHAEPGPDRARRAVEAVWRIESPRLIAGLTRLVHDIGVAEELAQDALVSALEQWPRDGVPRNPGAWLMTTAKRRGIDLIRRNETFARKLQLLGHELETAQGAAVFDGPGDAAQDAAAIEDDLLRLVFVACHPVLSREARVALTLRLLGGLTTDEVARAFLVAEPTVAQRIVRAKRTLAKEKVPFEVPQGAELAVRLASVLEVVYLIFNEGYSATAGDDWMRPGLCEDAVRLARVLQGLMPAEPEVHGLAALLEVQASRSAARIRDGAPVTLLDQDRRRWDQLLIRRGFAALARAEVAARARGAAPGPYALQAAIAACHAQAVRAEDTDWPRIAGLYRALAATAPSPVVELNRAVAVGMAEGPAAGLALADALAASGELAGYHLLPSVRGDLLARLGRTAEARAEFVRAAGLTRNGAEQALLLRRAADLDEA